MNFKRSLLLPFVLSIVSNTSFAQPSNFNDLLDDATQGKITAQNNLAGMYYLGEGVVQDYAKAFEWYSKSAVQGNAEAQFNLGKMYDKGRGVTQDYVKAFEWYDKSAAQGNAFAQYN